MFWANSNKTNIYFLLQFAIYKFHNFIYEIRVRQERSAVFFCVHISLK